MGDLNERFHRFISGVSKFFNADKNATQRKFSGVTAKSHRENRMHVNRKLRLLHKHKLASFESVAATDHSLATFIEMKIVLNVGTE